MMNPEKTRPENIDEYIAAFPKDTQKVLEKLRAVIKKAAPGATETISYQIPTFRLGINLVHFAGWKNHIGFYPGAAGIEIFKDDLASYEVTKGTVKFPIGQPLPVELITRIVKFRVKQNLEKAAARNSRRPKSI
jgi:uncharacterized protein YdhG (YjbR/CyaY superfamily)